MESFVWVHHCRRNCLSPVYTKLLAILLLCVASKVVASGRLKSLDVALHYRSRAQEGDLRTSTSSTLDVPGRNLEETIQTELAATYMDSLLANPQAARTSLAGKLVKRSNAAVVYMCFERMDMIHRALPAILSSDGIEEFDLFISQDGGAPSIFVNQNISIPSDMAYAYIRHPANLCAGLHHYFVKMFAFDIMGYDVLLIVEEDNVVHPQGLQLLRRMAELSVREPDIGAVSLLDMDMSRFLDAQRFGAGLIRTNGTVGHLWVFGLHRVKYDGAVRSYLRSYYEVIKKHNYRMKHEQPLRGAIEALMQEMGFPATSELSQDRWFINSLAKAGFTKRYQTLFRFFEPIGNYGLHFHYNESRFFDIYGHRMFEGRIEPRAAFDITKDPSDVAAIMETVSARLQDLFNQYWDGVKPNDQLVFSTFNKLMDGQLNGLDVVRNTMRNSKAVKPPKQRSL